jgi:hypothetical protein
LVAKVRSSSSVKAIGLSTSPPDLQPVVGEVMGVTSFPGT